MAANFCSIFHSCVIHKNYLGFNENGNLVEQKKRNTPLFEVLPKISATILQMEDRKAENIQQLLGDVTLLEKRYKARIDSCGWKFKKFICMILSAIKILKVNPFARHEEETLKQLNALRHSLSQMTIEPAPVRLRDPVPPKPEP